MGRRGQTLWLWFLFLLLAVLLGILAYGLVQALSSRGGKSADEPAGLAAGPWGDRYCYGGLPRATASFPYPITVLTNTGYLVGYCERRKDPVWVCYRLFRPDHWEAPPRPQAFRTDYRTAARANPNDYSGSGYDRGHMAPNYAIALCYGPQAQLETFLMSNIIPQRPALNRQVWKHLEQDEIRDYAPRFGQLWVIDGPVFYHDERLKGGEAIPDACFKIMVRAGNRHPEPHILAFLVPQSVSGAEPPGRFLTSVRQIEQETGLDFFNALPPDLQRAFEETTALETWSGDQHKSPGRSAPGFPGWSHTRAISHSRQPSLAPP